MLCYSCDVGYINLLFGELLLIEELDFGLISSKTLLIKLIVPTNQPKENAKGTVSYSSDGQFLENFIGQNRCADSSKSFHQLEKSLFCAHVFYDGCTIILALKKKNSQEKILTLGCTLYPMGLECGPRCAKVVLLV